jgi:ribosomal protein L39E
VFIISFVDKDKRKSYFNAYKLALAVKKARAFPAFGGLHREKKSDLSMFKSYWKRSKVEMEKDGGGRKNIIFVDLEDVILEWIIDRRSRKLDRRKVSTSMNLELVAEESHWKLIVFHLKL